MTLTAPVSVDHEERLLIDGRLVHAGAGDTFEVVNPDTGRPAGVVADAAAADMDQAIAAARRPFDAGTWARDHALRQRCLRQLHAAIGSEEALRHDLVTEVGAPLSTTYLAQLDWPLEDALTWPADAIEDLAWERRLPDKSTARGVRTSSPSINGGVFYSADSLYGGYKASGIGRQGGLEGLATYLETKEVASALPLPLG